jgi:hypothetical protein
MPAVGNVPIHQLKAPALIKIASGIQDDRDLKILLVGRLRLKTPIATGIDSKRRPFGFGPQCRYVRTFPNCP